MMCDPDCQTDLLVPLYTGFNGTAVGTGSLQCVSLVDASGNHWTCLQFVNSTPSIPGNPPVIATRFVSSLPFHPNGAYQTTAVKGGLLIESDSPFDTNRLMIDTAEEIEQIQAAFKRC